MAPRSTDSERHGSAAGSGGRSRDAARSRDAILDAAERLFAERGFDGASLEEIGAAAGVSRGTPSYFFGSKDGLYRAVLERVFKAREAFLDERFERALAKLPAPPAKPDQASLRAAIEEAVDAYSAFLATRPTFVQLVQREAVDSAKRMAAVRTGAPAVHHLLGEILERVSPSTASRQDVRHLLLTFVSLLFFPHGHASTLMKSLELDPRNARFARERNRHVVELLLSAINST